MKKTCRLGVDVLLSKHGKQDFSPEPPSDFLSLGAEETGAQAGGAAGAATDVGVCLSPRFQPQKVPGRPEEGEAKETSAGTRPAERLR